MSLVLGLLAVFVVLESAPVQVLPGPIDMEPAPSVNWTCRVETEDNSFALNGVAPDFAGRREPYARQLIEVKTDGPDWARGKHEIVALASAPNFRRYLMTWDAKDGGSYSLDIVLLQGELGISSLTYRPSPSDAVKSIFSKQLGSGVCESKFPTAVAGIVTQ